MKKSIAVVMVAVAILMNTASAGISTGIENVAGISTPNEDDSVATTARCTCRYVNGHLICTCVDIIISS